MESDSDLVTRSRQGHFRAFDELVRRHYNTVLRIAYRFVAVPEDAADLFQGHEERPIPKTFGTGLFYPLSTIG